MPTLILIYFCSFSYQPYIPPYVQPTDFEDESVKTLVDTTYFKFIEKADKVDIS